MRRLYTALAIAALLSTPGIALAAGGAGVGGDLGSSDSRERSGEKIARTQYEKGLKKREEALAHEQAAAQAQGDAQKKELSAATRSWEDALQLFQRAVRSQGDFYQALNEIGHAQRKLGHYDESLQAYGKALAIEPNYAPAIEYLGETYLGLNRIGEARTTYLRLFQLDRPLAGQLMTALVGWADRAEAEPPQGVDPQALKDFVGWVRERKDLAAQTGEGSAKKSW